MCDFGDKLSAINSGLASCWSKRSKRSEYVGLGVFVVRGCGVVGKRLLGVGIGECKLAGDNASLSVVVVDGEIKLAGDNASLTVDVVGGGEIKLAGDNASLSFVVGDDVCDLAGIVGGSFALFNCSLFCSCFVVMSSTFSYVGAVSIFGAVNVSFGSVAAFSEALVCLTAAFGGADENCTFSKPAN